MFHPEIVLLSLLKLSYFLYVSLCSLVIAEVDKKVNAKP